MYLWTSESVSDGHPDKLADQISDAVLDAMIAQDPYSRVACETLVSTGLVLVAGEITTDCYVDIPKVVRNTIKDVGYTKAEYGFDYYTCSVLTSIDEQSPDIALGTIAEHLGFFPQQIQSRYRSRAFSYARAVLVETWAAVGRPVTEIASLIGISPQAAYYLARVPVDRNLIQYFVNILLQ